MTAQWHCALVKHSSTDANLYILYILPSV